MPDLDSAPAISRLLKFARLARDMGLGVSIPAGSALGLAGSITSPDTMLRWCYKQPDLVHRLIRLSTDYLLTISDR